MRVGLLGPIVAAFYSGAVPCDEVLAVPSNPQVDACVSALSEASEGLWWISESDDQFQVVKWSEELSAGFGPERLLAHLGRPATEPVEVRTVDDFFRRAITDQPWHSPQEQDTVRRYRVLVAAIKTELADPIVYRVSADDHLDTFVLGSAGGVICGLSTTEVET
ncbi:MAG: nuclease A inhibitor family protein [Myxococcaceae bacterium]